MIGIFATVFLVAFEAMAVAAAMPVVGRDLGGLQFYAWGFSAYLIASLVAMVASGELGDRHGPRWTLLGGVGLFVLGLVVAGSAQTMLAFVLARALQGAGGGFQIVALYLVIARGFDAELRPKVFAAISAAWVLPSIVGPAVAGYLAENVSWRWVFLGIAPLVVPAVALIAARLREFDGPSATDGVEPSAGVRGPRRVLLAAVAALGVALVQLAGQDLTGLSLLLGALGLALLGPALRRLLPVGAFRFARGLPTSVIMRGILAAAFFGAESFVPLMLVEHRGLDATYSGLSLTSGALGWALGSWLQSRPGLRMARHRFLQLGAALVLVSIMLVSLVVLDGVPVWLVAVAWVIGGLGMGLGMTTSSVLVMAQSPVADQGANSAALQISDGALSVIFIGIGGSVLAAGGGAHATGGTFAGIYAIMAVVALIGVLVAPRVRGSADLADTGVAARVR